MIKINSDADIEQMRSIGKIAATQLEELMDSGIIKKGVTTDDINDFCLQHTLKNECLPAPPDKGFPKAVCTSPNHVVCHGVPSDKVLKDGDIVNVDVTPKNSNGFHGDTSVMLTIGKGGVMGNRLCNITRECLYLGIKQVKPGATLNSIGGVIQNHAKSNGLSVFYQFTGHGINTIFHDDPTIHHVYFAGDTTEMEPGMIFTIEPILTPGKVKIRLLPDGWTYVTADHKPTAQWEHTVLVTETGYDILTYRNDDTIDKEG